MTSSTITFIVPCYNEEVRIEFAGSSFSKYLANTSLTSKIIFVDDGSKDKTKELLEKITSEINNEFGAVASIVSYRTNQGKGWALKKGIEKTTTDWCLTIDADMAAEPLELTKWMASGLNLDTSNGVFIGSREKGIRDQTVKSSWTRRNIGLTFNMAMRILTGLKLKDTQCGFKLYRTAIAKEMFHDLLDYGFAHDVEILIKLKKLNIDVRSMPLKWEEKSGSKVSVFRDGLKMLKTVVLLRSKYALSK